MAVLSIIMQLLSPIFSLGLFVAQPLTQTNPVRARAKLDKWVTHLPQGFWARLHYIWERPLVKSIRITASIANWSVRLPAIAALLLAQGGAMASTISFPMLAPLLLGTGMMMNSIKANASFIIPRLGLMVVLLWVLWFFTNVVQTTWVVLCKQGRIDLRTLAGARMITECTSLLLAGIVVLSMLGINISALLLPTGVVLAIASRDLLQNFIAGFFLVLAQPFRLGDKVAVSCSAPGVGSLSSAAAAAAVRTPTGTTAAATATTTGSSGHSTMHSVLGGERSTGAAAGSSSSSSSTPPGWFEGICEKVDLRYTVLRDGWRCLMVPNTAFVSREFLVYDEGPEAIKPAVSSSSSSSSSWWWQHKSTSTGQDQAAAAGQPGSAGNGARGQQQQPADRQQTRSPAPEPAIVEGHMTTQLPPLGAPGMAQPIYPGMHFVAAPHPGYHSPFPHMHYQQQPMQGWGVDQQQQQPLQGWGLDPFQDPFFNQQQGWGMEQQQQQQQEQPPHDWQQQQQQQGQRKGEDQASSEQDPEQQHGARQQEGEQQQQQQQRKSRPVAKGPPGYLPQGFAAAPPYYGIPVGTLYYGVPGVMPWPTSAAPGQPNARPVQQGGNAAATSQDHSGYRGQQQQQQQRRQAQQPNARRSQEGSSGDGVDDPGSGSEAGSNGGRGETQTLKDGGRGGGGGGAETQSGDDSTSTAAARNGSQQQHHHQQQQYGQTCVPSYSRSNGSHQAGAAHGRGFSHQPTPQAVQQQQQQAQTQRGTQQTRLQQQAGQAKPRSHAASHSMHVAAGAGFGMWGMVPPPPPVMQSWEQSGSMQYPQLYGMMPSAMDQAGYHAPSDAWALNATGSAEELYAQQHYASLLQQQQPWQYQQDRSHQPLQVEGAGGADNGVAAEGLEGPEAVVEPGSVPQGEVYSQGSNLVMAVLQEFTRQQF